ncbi:hypothetical protein Fot_15264 [Forsythia ovata]|uniref:Uncharacterized protein n=1 Tax=Forsythia ovata TaxID=205694 RepID=A0ABD1W8M8_9LAMI
MDASLDEEYESISVINIVTDLNDSFENPPMLDEKFEEYLNFDSDDNYDYASIVDEYPSVEMLRAWYKEFKGTNLMCKQECPLKHAKMLLTRTNSQNWHYEASASSEVRLMLPMLCSSDPKYFMLLHCLFPSKARLQATLRLPMLITVKVKL